MKYSILHSDEARMRLIGAFNSMRFGRQEALSLTAFKQHISSILHLLSLTVQMVPQLVRS